MWVVAHSVVLEEVAPEMKALMMKMLRMRAERAAKTMWMWRMMADSCGRRCSCAPEVQSQ